MNFDLQRVLGYARSLIRTHDSDVNAHGAGAWKTYTPTVTATVTNPVLGTGGAAYGLYQQIGKTVHFKVRIESGTNPSAGAGEYRFQLPVPTTTLGGTQILGAGYIYDSVGTACVATYATSTTFVILGSGQSSNASNGVFHITSGRVYTITGTYEAA